MYIIDIQKNFANTNILSELLKLFTGTNQYNSEPKIIFDKSGTKKSCKINIDVNHTSFYINLWLKVENENFINNGFSIEVATDDNPNILEWEHIEAVNNILSEYWRYVRPDINC